MIKWEKILGECLPYRQGFLPYRQGFVDVFKKYEGQPTDEKNERGGVVKVTQSSFARHAGIAKMTFNDWVRASNRTDTVPPERQLHDDFDEVVAGLVLDIPGDADINTRLEHAVELAREGMSFKKIGDAVGLGESVVRRDMIVREAKAELDSTFDPVGSARNLDQTIACGLRPVPDVLEDIELFVLHLLSSAYTLSKTDKNRLKKILTIGIQELEKKYED